MALRVAKAGEVVGDTVICVPSRQAKVPDVIDFLTNLSSSDADELGPQWAVALTIGEGPATRELLIELPPFLSKHDYERSEREPIFVERPGGGDPSTISLLVLFRGRLFTSERRPITALEREEVILRAKEIVYREHNELSSLRAYVANIEAAEEFQRSGTKRDPIADDVKLVVWARDGGACVRCGSKEKLHFDHVIPVAKGGGGDAVNIQLLCQPCNLRKSDKIAF